MKQRRRRNRVILGVLALGLLAGGALTARPAQAVDGPYYAKPAWDQSLPAATRFVVLTNWASQAVLDKETGLVWEKSPDATLRLWSAATLACATRKTGGRKGWRLPSIHELASLIDPSVPNPGPALPPGHPFTNIQFGDYWSATTIVEINNPRTSAYLVRFNFGYVIYGLKDNNAIHAWCVRGGMNAAAY